MNHKRLAALKNLMERPGTKAEGDLARKMYEREMAKGGSSYQAPPPKQDPPKHGPFNWEGFRPPPPPPNVDIDAIWRMMADIGFGGKYGKYAWYGRQTKEQADRQENEWKAHHTNKAHFYELRDDPFEWTPTPRQQQRKEQSVPVCPCGKVLERDPVSGEQFCENELVHNHMKTLLENEFPMGTRVYYNGPVYPKNYAGTILDDHYKYCRWNQLMIRWDDKGAAVSYVYLGTIINAFYCGTMRLTKQPIA